MIQFGQLECIHVLNSPIYHERVYSASLFLWKSPYKHSTCHVWSGTDSTCGLAAFCNEPAECDALVVELLKVRDSATHDSMQVTLGDST